jgi:hypothetical protein
MKTSYFQTTSDSCCARRLSTTLADLFAQNAMTFLFNRHPALSFCLGMISAQTPLAFVARENRYPLFRIMLYI